MRNTIRGERCTAGNVTGEVPAIEGYAIGGRDVVDERNILKVPSPKWMGANNAGLNIPRPHGPMLPAQRRWRRPPVRSSVLKKIEETPEYLRCFAERLE